MRRSFCLLVPFALAACYPAPREVRRTATGGEVAIYANVPEARDGAYQIMGSRCPNGFDIVEEGEVVIGVVASGQESGTVTRFGNRSTGHYSGSSYQTVEDKREWRFLYQCRTAPGVAVPGALPEVRPPQSLRELRVRVL